MALCAGVAAGAAANGRGLMLMNVLRSGRGAAANGFCGSAAPGFCVRAADVEVRTVVGLSVLVGCATAGLGGGDDTRPRGRADAASLASSTAHPNIKAVATFDTQASLASANRTLRWLKLGVGVGKRLCMVRAVLRGFLKLHPPNAKPAGKPGCVLYRQSLNPANRYERIMRAETEKLVEDIQRSIGLLRRHL
jgi:hypothetical protein